MLSAARWGIGWVLGVRVAESPALTLGGLLRHIRSSVGLTQEELAEAAGLSPRSVSDLERGVALTARKETARLLADALGLTGADRASFEAVARGRTLAGVPDTAFIMAGAALTRTLPHDIASFTGRQLELRQLMRAVASVADSGEANLTHAIGGMAGIGKTALAVHAAHQLAPQFRGGQIFLPLHGHIPGHQPVDPADALASLLHTTGVSSAEMPTGLEARTALWRDRVAGKQILLLLDDAVSTDQIQPLLPGDAESLVLVTSRRHLTALEDTQALNLDTFSAAEAAELLVRLSARPNLDQRDPAVAQITRLCGYLPLAVALLGRQLHHHLAWTVAELASDLEAAQNRLDLIRAEDLSIAATFELSYLDLTTDQRQLFRRLGLHPGTDFDAYAAAALNGTDLATTRRHLGALYDHYLIAEPTHGRYRFQGLIREHARVTAATDPPSVRKAATGRLLDYYLYTAQVAEGYITRQPRARREPTPKSRITVTGPMLSDRAQALSWAQAERANILACLDLITDANEQGRIAAFASLLRRSSSLRSGN